MAPPTDRLPVIQMPSELKDRLPTEERPALVALYNITSLPSHIVTLQFSGISHTEYYLTLKYQVACSSQQDMNSVKFIYFIPCPEQSLLCTSCSVVSETVSNSMLWSDSTYIYKHIEHSVCACRVRSYIYPVYFKHTHTHTRNQIQSLRN